MAFLKKMADAYPGYYLGICQNAESAASLTTYVNDTNKYSGGPALYSQIIAAARALQPMATIAGVVIMLYNNTTNYMDNAKALVAKLRSDLELDELPIIFSDYPAGHPSGPNTTVEGYNRKLAQQLSNFIVIPAQWSANVDKYMNVKIWDINKPDHHYNLEGYMRWAEEAVKVITSNNLGPRPINDTLAPSAPSNPVATDLSTTRIRLSWQASSDNDRIMHYIVYLGNDSIATTADTGFIMDNATACTEYFFFAIRARDFSGNISSGATHTHTSACSGDTQRPTAPGNLRVIDTTDSGFVLQWDASRDNVGVSGYYLYNQQQRIASSVLTRVTIDTLRPKIEYVLSVRAADAAGNLSNASNQLTLILPAAQAQLPLKVNIGGNAAVESVTVGGQLRIQWESNPDMAGDARLWLSPDSGNSWLELIDSTIGNADAQWEDFAWSVTAVLCGLTIEGRYCLIMITDYDEAVKVVGDQLCYIMPENSATKHIVAQKSSFHININTLNRLLVLHISFAQQYTVDFYTARGSLLESEKARGPGV
ncbi:MAG: hypothetical protein GF398_18910 [Chitinivibrionales bacterium]|nr:hypothetical protein [Chitinivibrionales bacterium]